MADLNNLTFDSIIGDEAFDDIVTISNSKATPDIIDSVVTDFTNTAIRNAINYADQTHLGVIRTASLKKITAWLLLHFAENGTSPATQYPDARVDFIVHEQTAARQVGPPVVPAVFVGRNTHLTLQICVNLIRTRTTQRHWARYYANLTFRLAKSKAKAFAWGRNNGVPSHYSYLGFDTADYIDQHLLSIQERKCIRRTGAFAIQESGIPESTEDDQVITAVGSKRQSLQ